MIKNKLEQLEICKNCLLNLYINTDESLYILEIDYMDGKFIAERNFPVSQSGVAKIEEVKELYKDENDFKKHFGII